MLERKLGSLYPQRSVEVVNAAGNTYASYRVGVVFDEIVEYEPDVILIWSGNNEFLERIVYGMVLPPWPWSHSAVARILHVATGRARAAKPVVDVESYVEADLVANRIGTAFGRSSALRADPEQYEQVVAHYRHNLTTMVREARRRDIPVLLIDVPVNLKDWRPNASFHREDLTDAEQEAFQLQYRGGVLASERGRAEEAAAAFALALEVDDRHAETHYLYGRALQTLGRLELARAAYQRAIAEDACPFRDIPRFREIRREIAARFDVPLVEAQDLLAEHAAEGIPGLDVLVDYVHPTLESNERIAQQVLATLAREELIPPDRALPLDAVRLRVPTDGSTNLRVLLKLYPQFLVMRQYDRIGPVAAAIQRAATPRPDDPPERVQSLQALSERIRRYQRVLVPYQKLLRAEKLGTLEQEFPPDRARRVYQRYVALVQELEGRDLAETDYAKLVPEFEYARP
jgi:tetratricopeptide (TPR) repeat protein